MSRREEFLVACKNGHLEVVISLLPYLNEGDIKNEDNEAFRWACKMNIWKLLNYYCPI